MSLRKAHRVLINYHCFLCVLCVCLSAHVCRSLQRSEEGVSFLELELQGVGATVWAVGTEHGSPARDTCGFGGCLFVCLLVLFF